MAPRQGGMAREHHKGEIVHDRLEVAISKVCTLSNTHTQAGKPLILASLHDSIPASHLFLYFKKIKSIEKSRNKRTNKTTIAK